jgi:predicted kinase
MQGVVVISGLPAAGKSTLAARLSADLGWAWVSRDRLGTSVLGDLADVVPEGEHVRLARAKDRLVNEVVETVLDIGGGVVLDGNFNTIEQANAVRAFLAARQVPAVETCLWADPATLRARFIERAMPPLSPDLEPYFERVVSRPRWTVLEAPSPIFEFDTTDLAVIDAAYPTLLSAIGTALGEERQV